MKEKIISNGKLVGIVEDKVYTTYRYPHHFMIKFKGFGISYRALLRIKELGVETIKIIYKARGGDNIEYEFTLDEYMNSELEYVDKGDLQKFINVKGGAEKKDDRLSTGSQKVGRRRELLETKGGAVQSKISFGD